MRKASIKLKTAEGLKLEAALRPEVSRPLPRTRVSTMGTDDDFHLEVVAKDTSALRAALNSYVRWISTALKMIKEAGR